ncbi:MAG: hypothetical protein RL417_1533 [Pseudomonadota bacterium]|jgi:UDP-galactopyranose mutase
MKHRHYRFSSNTVPFTKRSHATSRSVVGGADIIYFARKPWDCPRERGHEIVSAIARTGRVFYIEPPVTEDSGAIDLDITNRQDGLVVVTPYLPDAAHTVPETATLRIVIDRLIERYRLEAIILWYESAQALHFTRHLRPIARVYDYPRRTPLSVSEESERYEAELLGSADIIFTATQSVYERVRRLRPGAVHLFPDCPERTSTFPRSSIPAPPFTIGSILAADATLDLPLLEDIAAAAPREWRFEIITFEQELPTRPPLHPVHLVTREELFTRVAGWSAAIFPLTVQTGRPPLPLARIGEILQLSVPVVATPTTDIVGPLGRRGIIQLAQTRDEFIAALTFAFEQRHDPTWRALCAQYLSETTWTHTAEAMLAVVSVAAEPYTAATPWEVPVGRVSGG